MKRQLFLLTGIVLGALIGLAAGGTSHAQRSVSTVTVYSPSSGANLTSPFLSFSWNYIPYASAEVSIASQDGAQQIKVSGIAPHCPVANICSYIFNPEAFNWIWREHTMYEVVLKLKNSDGVVTAKSDKIVVTTDLLPQSVEQLSLPINYTVTSTNNVSFKWAPDTRVDQYRLVISGPDGFSYKSPWLFRTSICGGDCTIAYSFAGAPDGYYEWKVLGRRAYVAGKTKSPKRGLYVDLP